jgi:hypothetical protein
MRHRPKRENYGSGVFGQIDYLESLERYCTFLENQKKKKLFIIDCENGDDIVQVPVFASNGDAAYKKIARQFPTYNPMVIDSEIDLSFACS